MKKSIRLGARGFARLSAPVLSVMSLACASSIQAQGIEINPVVLIHKFSGSDEAAALANSVDFGLAACIWSSDLFLAQELAKKINAGIIWINTYGMFYNQLPYGGFKQSGFGKEKRRDSRF